MPPTTKSTIKNAPTTDERPSKPARSSSTTRPLGQSRGPGFTGGEHGGFPDSKPELARCSYCGGPMSKGADESAPVRCAKCPSGEFTGGGFPAKQAVADGGSERAPFGKAVK